MDYEEKWHSVIPDEDNYILQTEYRLARNLRKNLNLDQPERLSEKDRKVCDSPNTPTKGSESSRND